jgi:hypothetical protein
LHQSSFPANTKAGFQVIEFTPSTGMFFKTKNLWKLRLQIELLLLWRQQLLIATVNFCHFYDFPELSSSASKGATHPAHQEEV